MTKDDRDMVIFALKQDIAQRDRHITELLSKVDDLSTRLKATLQMDEIGRNQEIITLKKDIAAALRLEYEDFLENKSAECDKDMFEAFKASLNRIFRTLRRFGITLD